MTAVPVWAPRKAAAPAWLELQAAIRATRRRLPCEESPAVWWSTSPEDQATAVSGCRGCPIRVECLAYARVGREVGGVWGGLTPAERAPRKAAE